MTCEEDIAAATPNYQDNINMIQVTLDDPEREDLDFEDTLAIQRSFEVAPAPELSARPSSTSMRMMPAALSKVRQSSDATEYTTLT
jgi:hypothetical protein